jgi:hypothetical protein
VARALINTRLYMVADSPERRDRDAGQRWTDEEDVNPRKKSVKGNLVNLGELAE